MKRLNIYTYCLFTLLLTGILSCSPQKIDIAIKEDITVKAKEDINFAGVQYVVDKGTVTLTGSAPTMEAKQELASTVKGIAGVREVRNLVGIGPVVIDEDFPLQQSVDSVLKKYSNVQAQVENRHVLLLGQAAKQDIPELIKSIEQLPVNGVKNQLVIKEESSSK